VIRPRPVASLFAADGLARWTGDAYDLGRIDEVMLWNPGLNDTYVVRAGGERFVLRVYPRGWRTDADVRYELDVLVHLDRKRVPVAAPIARRDGELLGRVAAPEGERQAVLFAFAPGNNDVYFAREAEDARRYGAAAARIHAATDDFRSENARFPLDVTHFVDAALGAVLPRIGRRPDDVAYLERLGERLRRGFAELEGRGLDRGFCHGDFHGGNASKAEDGTVTFYDFDCCGPGWRAYDVAVFRWPLERQRRRKPRKLWPVFLEGYREVRPLGEADEAATAFFVCARELWHIALHVGGGPRWGYGWNAMNERYLDDKMGFLRKWARRHLGLRAP
jgi:Ser/Thr protein kinase RdoA (MazF antagonist)